ncbi:MAG: hypothetical protein H6730_04960 [Deltaproteobacteria bacterium]|nr:hypothetical protein [Deltaproteobacteria bacterium]
MVLPAAALILTATVAALAAARWRTPPPDRLAACRFPPGFAAPTPRIPSGVYPFRASKPTPDFEAGTPDLETLTALADELDGWSCSLDASHAVEACTLRFRGLSTSERADEWKRAYDAFARISRVASGPLIARTAHPDLRPLLADPFWRDALGPKWKTTKDGRDYVTEFRAPDGLRGSLTEADVPMTDAELDALWRDLPRSTIPVTSRPYTMPCDPVRPPCPRWAPGFLCKDDCGPPGGPQDACVPLMPPQWRRGTARVGSEVRLVAMDTMALLNARFNAEIWPHVPLPRCVDLITREWLPYEECMRTGSWLSR